MARRSDHSREEIKEMALTAALTILEEEGARGLTARKVATAIGYTVGTLYLVFKNQQEMVSQTQCGKLTGFIGQGRDHTDHGIVHTLANGILQA